jgi:hypothetical protein
MGANAQTSVPAFTAGQVLTAAQQTQINTGIPVFASTVTRDAAFGGTGEKTLAEGQACYIEGTGVQVYNGTAWKPYGYRQTFTPSWTNFTLGNGTVNYATYCQIDDFVFVEVKVTLGSTSSVTGAITMTLPVISTQATTNSQIGISTYVDSGTASYGGFIYAAPGSTTGSLGLFNVSGTYGTYNAVSATVPFTWTTNDVFEFQISYTV